MTIEKIVSLLTSDVSSVIVQCDKKGCDGKALLNLNRADLTMDGCCPDCDQQWWTHDSSPERRFLKALLDVLHSPGIGESSKHCVKIPPTIKLMAVIDD